MTATKEGMLQAHESLGCSQVGVVQEARRGEGGRGQVRDRCTGTVRYVQVGWSVVADRKAQETGDCCRKFGGGGGGAGVFRVDYRIAADQVGSMCVLR